MGMFAVFLTATYYWCDIRQGAQLSEPPFSHLENTSGSFQIRDKVCDHFPQYLAHRRNVINGSQVHLCCVLIIWEF